MKEGDYANGKIEYQSNFRKLLGTAVSNDSEALAGLQLPRAFCFLGFLMEKAPAFQFYASDFLSDENVMLMDNRAVGCYIKLLCINWKQGSIPSDIEKIARLCGEDGSVMAQLWPSLERCFISKKNGRLINPRIEKERLKQQRFREERSTAGKKGACNRWKDKDKNGSAIDLPMAKNGFSSSSSSSLKNNPSIPFQEIVEYLNEKSGKIFKWQNKKTQSQIRARWKEGSTLEDFKHVIDIKCQKWLSDPEMADFVRPVTLFGAKFEGYKNESRPKPKSRLIS